MDMIAAALEMLTGRCMRLLAVGFGLISLGFAQGPVKLKRQGEPKKALIFEVLVPANPAAVWEAFTTSEGLSTWLTPGAVVELRAGGEWTAHFPNGGTGGGTILRYEPQ